MRPSFILFALIPVFGCGGGRSHEASLPVVADMAYEKADVQEPGSTGNGQLVALPMDRKVIRSGDLRFEVDDLDTARHAVLEQVKAAGGYVEGDERGDWGHQRTVTMRMRIPAEQFDGFVQDLHGLGRLEHQNISATDVTSEWVDVEARLEAKRTLEKRYLELAGQAKNVSEMLEVEHALGNVRAEIESMEARMNVLRDQVAMSTLTITCTKQQAIAERFTPRFGVAVREGWNNLLRFFVGLTHLWPFVLLCGGLVWWWRRRRRVKS